MTKKIITYLTKAFLLFLLLLTACSFSNSNALIYQAESKVTKENLLVEINVTNQGRKVQTVSDLPFVIELYSSEDTNQKPLWVWDAENHTCPTPFQEIDGEIIIIGAGNIVSDLPPNDSWNFGRTVPLKCLPSSGNYYVKAITEDIRRKTKVLISAGKITLP